jgi:DNA modification methylase
MRKIKRRLKPFCKFGKSNLYQGHVLAVLRKIPSESVQCCITSPPYWGLRDYDTTPQIWDAYSNCEHEWGKRIIKRRLHTDRGTSTLSGSNKDQMQSTSYKSFSQTCRYCTAWRGSLGLEPHPNLYVKHLTDIFNEVKRILKPDGILWLNLGDSYAGGGGVHGIPEDWDSISTKNRSKYPDVTDPKRNAKAIGLKPKDLVGIPWKVAFALQSAGWYLRQDIIWQKPNPMPESVTDRCTKTHEYIFMFSKSQKYYFNYKAIREPCSPANIADFRGRKTMMNKGDHGGTRKDLDRSRHDYIPDDLMRNKRSVWTVNSSTYKGAHFAVFPEKLIQPCILAGTKKDDVVIDPFMGSGTTAVLCEKAHRNWLGIELSKKYVKMIKRRVTSYHKRRMSSLGLT